MKMTMYLVYKFHISMPRMPYSAIISLITVDRFFESIFISGFIL